MVTKAEMCNIALQELQKSSDDIMMTVLVTLDGLVMAFATSTTLKKETFAAYVATVFRRADDTMEKLTDENVVTMIYESGNHRVITIRTGFNALLTVLTGLDARMGLVLLEMQKTSQKIREILD